MKSSCNSTGKGKDKSRENDNRIEEGNNREVQEWYLISLCNTTWQNLRFLLKNEEVIKAADVAKGVSIVHSKQRSQIMDEVEKLLLIWRNKKELDGDSISEGIICEKVLRV